MGKTTKVNFINHSKLKRALLLLWQAGVPACIIGGVGCGKTTAVEDLIDEVSRKTGKDIRTHKVFLGMIESTDVGGIPVRDEASGKIRHAMPEYLPFDSDEECVILGDEYDRAQPDVQNAFNQILLGGEIHGHKISPNAYTILTMNGTSDKYTTQLSEAARNRICTLFLSANTAGNIADWDEWATKNGINDTIRGFAHFRHDLIETHDKFEELAMMTMRSRDMAGKVLDAADAAGYKTDDILRPVLAGIIGDGAAVELMAFRNIQGKLPDINRMLKKPHEFETHECFAKADMCYALAIALSGHLKPDEDGKVNQEAAENAITITGFMPDEIAVWAIKGVVQSCPEVVSTEAYQEFFTEYKDMLLD